jgi:branched-chain amino acid transport system substrate-binding protein
MANAGGDFINAMKAAKEFGITKSMKVAGLLVFVNDVHSLGLANTQGLQLAAMLLLLTDVHSLGLAAAQKTYLTVPSYWDMNDGTRAFTKKFEARVGRPPTFLQAGVYSSVRHYLQAVKAAGSVDADTVMAKMKTMPIDDPFSLNAHIRADGLVVRDMMLAQVKTPEQSKASWDYYNIVRTIPGESLAWPLSDSQCPLVKP